jgi:hypothetical protein
VARLIDAGITTVQQVGMSARSVCAASAAEAPESNATLWLRGRAQHRREGWRDSRSVLRLLYEARLEIARLRRNEATSTAACAWIITER